MRLGRRTMSGIDSVTGTIPTWARGPSHPNGASQGKKGLTCGAPAWGRETSFQKVKSKPSSSETRRFSSISNQSRVRSDNSLHWELGECYLPKRA